MWDEEEMKFQHRIAQIMVASVRKHMPGAEILQVTDESTPLIPGIDAVKRKTYEGYFIPWIIEHLSEIQACDLLWLDTDIVVQKDVGHLFRSDFDVLMTAKQGKTVLQNINGIQYTMPLNFGVCLSRNPEFFKEVLRRVRKMTEKELLCWWGAQVAAYEIHKEKLFKFYVVPSEKYNFSPKTKEDDISDKYIVHYKGRHRKIWMLRHESQGAVAEA